MADSGVNINLGDALPWLEDRVRAIFGKDVASLELANWFKELQETATKQTSVVYCLGMHRPIPFDDIYQPTRLTIKGNPQAHNAGESYAYVDAKARSIARGLELDEHSITIADFLASGEDALIFSGPGWGKTTFLHHIFRRTIADPEILPVLITLRMPRANEDLQRFVETVSRITARHHRSKTLLLVDGYDELGKSQRAAVSDLLLRYQAREIGPFYLTCRDYYQVFNLAAPEARIDAFDRQDKYAFVKAFLAAYRPGTNAQEILNDLEVRGFSEFLAHPLLLALACILKASRSNAQPRSALKLLESALDVLCYLWDDKKGIDRECVTPLDGKDRLKVLKKIAYVAKSPHLPRLRAETLASKQINLLTFDKVDPREVLMEIAKFYGILIPSDDGYEFVHRTIHDFLAAQYWVESGEFARLTQYEWNSRTAYAACMSEDATVVLEAALASSDGLPAVAEILSNSPSFDMGRVSDAIVKYFSAPDRLRQFNNSVNNRVTGQLESDFVRLASNRFLNFMVERFSMRRSNVKDIIVGYCLIELSKRGLKLDFSTYQKAIGAYGLDRFTFSLVGIAQVQLGFLSPIP